jgi:hypothetical protein
MQGKEFLGEAGQGQVRYGMARRCSAGLGKEFQGMAGRGQARRGRVR